MNFPRLKTYRSRYNFTAFIVAVSAVLIVLAAIGAAGVAIFWLAGKI